MKLKLVVAFVIIFTSSVTAQQPLPRNYDLKIGLSDYPVSENYATDRAYNYEVFDNQFIKVIQFYEHPTNEQKMTLASQGVQLIGYLPNYAWLASFANGFDFAALSSYHVRAIIDVPSAYKLAGSLQLEDYHSHALDGDNIKLLVTFFNTINLDKITADLNAKGFVNTPFEDLPFAKVLNIPISQINSLAALPYVQYIEQTLPEPTLDAGFVEDRNNERSNYLASEQANGLSYDGTGFTIAVKEGGTVDTAFYNDLKGRLNNTLDGGASASGHKTGVARRMGAFGNDNPLNTGMAFGADIVSTTGSFVNLIATTPSIIVNNSYGYGCSVGNYGASGNFNDNLIRNNPTFMIAYSAGNIQTTDCGYGAGAGWGTITGDVKQAKNVIAVGAVNTSDNLMGFSSWGPAPDGRIKPDICAVGPGGTSFACPNVVGGFAQLYHAYFDKNGTVPNSGLIKGILQNTADDLGNPGPDFKYGYGRINMRRAYEVIHNNTIFSGSIANTGINNHYIKIPNGIRQIRIMVYWTDYEGTVGSSVALVNNLNMSVTDQNATVYEPWILNHTVNALTLDLNATRGLDNLNNMEQITIDNPTAGKYIIHINGESVPQGPQPYYVIYEMLRDELTLTYPIGGESMLPSETQRIYWDSYGDTNGTFDLSYSTDSGMTWTSIVSGLPNDTRFYDWTVPNTITGNAKIRVERGVMIDESAEGFSIIDVPNNLALVWSCYDSLKLSWDAVADADGYEIFKLDSKYMTSVGTTTNTHFTVNDVSTTENEYFAVRALGADNAKGRRTNSFEKTPGDVNCVPIEIAGKAILSHPSGYYPDCYTPFGNNIKFKFQNSGVNAINSLAVSYQLDNGSIQTEMFNEYLASGDFGEHTFANAISILTPGTYTLKAWVNPSDANINNDTATSEITIFSGGTGSYPYVQSFDTWTNCSTSWGCLTVTCPLEDFWYNVPFDAEKGDSTEWRTLDAGTGTGGTGPSGDHTTGSGKYLYIESSGNNGSGCQHDEAQAYTPCIDLSAATKPELTFWYHAFGNSIGELHVDLLVDGQWIEDVATPIAGEQGDVWLEHKANLVPYAGKTVIIRFRGTVGGGYRGDLAIDDIVIEENPDLDGPPTSTNMAASSNEHQLSISDPFPNPAQQTVALRISNPQTMELNIAVHNQLGQLIDVQQFNKGIGEDIIQLNAMKWNEGVYFITISNDDFSTTKKVIIQR